MAKELKRLILAVLIALLLLGGCGRTVTGDINFDAELKEIEQYTLDFATGNGDIDSFRVFIEDFNDKLAEVDIEFAQLQRKANELRLEGFTEMDYEKINESTALQAQVLEIYYEIKDAK